MEDIIKISEGHYKDVNTNDEYMSIYTYKIKNGFSSFYNSEGFNSKEALEFKDECKRKFVGEFTKSEKYFSGYMYKLDCLDNYYKDMPRKPKYSIGN